MNPEDPESAQRIVAEYVGVLERDAQSNVYPSAARALPHPKVTIKTAIETCVGALETSGLMTGELQDFLEVAYVSLADYVDDDLARLMTEFQEAGDRLAADGRLTREKLATPAWHVLVDSSRLAGEIALAIAEETEALRREFRRLQAAAHSQAPKEVSR